ncbi:hypothetical protein CBOM_06322 [Ceraceosorus bombacis]|uniref:Uncharacterized protein n=1 Tax=Ceraceosorus bombacis TaxID=401625 RepID=A0A0P1BRS8_9BASI|nr:hypothetical protein CBOM_06322 [Ceraceosorus bombacis]
MKLNIVTVLASLLAVSAVKQTSAAPIRTSEDLADAVRDSGGPINAAKLAEGHVRVKPARSPYLRGSPLVHEDHKSTYLRTGAKAVVAHTQSTGDTPSKDGGKEKRCSGSLPRGMHVRCAWGLGGIANWGRSVQMEQFDHLES